MNLKFTKNYKSSVLRVFQNLNPEVKEGKLNTRIFDFSFFTSNQSINIWLDLNNFFFHYVHFCHEDKGGKFIVFACICRKGLSCHFYFSYLSELYSNFYVFDVRKTRCTRGSQVLIMLWPQNWKESASFYISKPATWINTITQRILVRFWWEID